MGDGDRHASLLGSLDEALAAGAGRLFFSCGDRSYSYRDTHDAALALAGRLAASGTARGHRIAIDLGNRPELVFLLFAAAMLDAAVYLLNHRLTPARKQELLAGYRVDRVVDADALDALAALEPLPVAPAGAAADAVFVRMFTSGTTGAPKCACLTQRALLGAARASAERFLEPGDGLWQLALPMYHVGGLQVVLRSLVNRSAFRLYERFDARELLADAERLSATHVSVVDRMLQEMLATAPETVRGYRVVLLGGGPPAGRTLEAARDANLHVSYGLTEACATVAERPLAEFCDGPSAGGMRLLPGYSARILDADETGAGEISLAGPGLFAGYETPDGEPSASSPFTSDGYFRTGDRGRLTDGFLVVEERLSDLFISGGENVYPAEVEREIVAAGSREAVVIGVPDDRWGRRPVAFVTGAAPSPEALEQRLSRFQRPDRIFVLDELPATAIGKPDRRRLTDLDAQRIEIASVVLHRIVQPLVTPFANAQTVMHERESVIVEVIDHAGCSGYGEGVAFTTPWYTDETVDTTIAALRDHLAPALVRAAFLHPAEVAGALAFLPGNLMAKGALEPACWDLYGRVTGIALPDLLAAHLGTTLQPSAAAGVSLGILPIAETLEAVRTYRAKGYRRVKLKIAPGDDVERVRAVREANPDLMLMADANRAYGPGDAEVFRRLDEFGLVCVEEPVAGGVPALSALQDLITTPVCVDESAASEADLEAVFAAGNLRTINLKIGKVGGLTPALELYRRCAEEGVELWLGGMFETGVSKYLHAAFERLPDFRIPGDISESRRYFERDIVNPEVTVAHGDIVMPDGPGLGFEIDGERLEAVTVERIVVTRDGD